MTAGFMIVTMEDIVPASAIRFLRLDAAVLCLDFFQSMLTKIMLASAVLCSSGAVVLWRRPCSVAAAEPAEHAESDHGFMALLVEAATA